MVTGPPLFFFLPRNGKRRPKKLRKSTKKTWKLTKPKKPTSWMIRVKKNLNRKRKARSRSSWIRKKRTTKRKRVRPENRVTRKSLRAQSLWKLTIALQKMKEMWVIPLLFVIHLLQLHLLYRHISGRRFSYFSMKRNDKRKYVCHAG